MLLGIARALATVLFMTAITIAGETDSTGRMAVQKIPFYYDQVKVRIIGGPQIKGTRFCINGSTLNVAVKSGESYTYDKSEIDTVSFSVRKKSLTNGFIGCLAGAIIGVIASDISGHTALDDNDYTPALYATLGSVIGLKLFSHSDRMIGQFSAECLWRANSRTSDTGRQ